MYFELFKPFWSLTLVMAEQAVQGHMCHLGWEKAYYCLFETDTSFTTRLGGGYSEISLHSGVFTLVPSAPSMLWCKVNPVSVPVLSWAMHGPYWAVIKSVVGNNHEGNLWNPEKEKHFIQSVWWKSSIGGIVTEKAHEWGMEFQQRRKTGLQLFSHFSPWEPKRI